MQITFWSSVLSLFLWLCFPGGFNNKEFACHAGDLGFIPGLRKSPGEGNGNPSPKRLPGEFHGQRSLADYSPWIVKSQTQQSN